MDIILLVKGVIIGFFIAVPVGPIALACIQRTLLRGRLSGITSGMGATTADIFYGTIAGLGSLSISQFLINNQNIVKVISGIILLAWGFKIFFPKISTNTIEIPKTQTLITDYFSMFFLTLINPLTILFFPALYASFDILTNNNTPSIGLLMFGILIGSSLWWIFLCTLLSLFRELIIKKWLLLVNKFIGILIAICGIGTLISIILH